MPPFMSVKQTVRAVAVIILGLIAVAAASAVSHAVHLPAGTSKQLQVGGLTQPGPPALGRLHHISIDRGGCGGS